ncbi:phage tail family protein [Heyndrickxia faecalis]|uniref:phage tail family protein n=1 Tax=Heyndrickxia faecalis TaxID=2824910 RepID=UPI003D247CB7
METLTIEKLNGERLDVEEVQGARLVSVEDSGPQPSTEYSQLTGVDGNIDMGTTFGTRTIKATFIFKGLDAIDYTLAQQEIWQLFFDHDPYYITWSRLPGKRFLVHCKPFTDTRINPYAGTYEIEFDAYTGFAESRGRTDEDPIDLDSDKWQIFGQGIELDEDLVYTDITSSSFKIFNAGDITIDPRKHDLTISIQGIGTPILKNLTTGDSFIYKKTLDSGDTLTIDGVYPLLNGAHCGRDTNHGLVTLLPGWNKIQLTGLSNPVSSFGFRFLYK